MFDKCFALMDVLSAECCGMEAADCVCDSHRGGLILRMDLFELSVFLAQVFIPTDLRVQAVGWAGEGCCVVWMPFFFMLSIGQLWECD
jgi:hypothetical protein